MFNDGKGSAHQPLIDKGRERKEKKSSWLARLIGLFSGPAGSAEEKSNADSCPYNKLGNN